MFAESGSRAECSDTLNAVSAAELTVPSSSHHVKISVDRDDTSVSAAAHDTSGFLIEYDLLGRVQTLFITMAKLAIVTVTPSVNITTAIKHR